MDMDFDGWYLEETLKELITLNIDAKIDASEKTASKVPDKVFEPFLKGGLTLVQTRIMLEIVNDEFIVDVYSSDVKIWSRQTLNFFAVFFLTKTNNLLEVRQLNTKTIEFIFERKEIN